MNKIQKDQYATDTNADLGYESNDRFKNAFSEIIDSSPTGKNVILLASLVNTKLGPMIAIADNDGLYLLDFIDRHELEKRVEKLKENLSASIITGSNTIILSIVKEINSYFSGKLSKFKTPIHFIGSSFQKRVWSELINVPFGTTKSYADIARIIKKPKAFRAVANANGANHISIAVPCHRVINSNNNIGGYGGGINRKEWLLEHEKKYM